MTSIMRILTMALLAATALRPAFADGGTIREVRLSSGGLAEVVRSVPVGGGGAVRIEVPLDQVDDVLKSLVVIGGAARVRSLSLGGLSPVDEVMRRMPFSADDMAGLPSLLGRLQGVRVEAGGSGRKVTGTVLGVSAAQGENGAQTPVLAVLADEGGAIAVPLTAEVAVKILDASVLAKIAEASAAIGRARADGSRTISLVLEGPEGGRADIAYVVAAPIWKTAYRVVVNAGKSTARLQAWAVLENATGENWDDVRLTLSSGSPVTLKQRLFERYWRERPEVPVDVNGVAAPRPDGGAMAKSMDQRLNEPARALAAPAAAPYFGEGVADMAMAMAAPSPAGTRYEAAAPTVEASAAEGDVSAAFAVPGTVDLAAGETLSVPILDRDVKAERIALFQPNGGSAHPVAALMLRNDTPTSLPPGILTMYDGTDGYLGDAQLLALPAGETRMASFALDRKVRISSIEEPLRTMMKVKAAGGMLTADVRSRIRTVYTIEGAADGARDVVIEHALRPGWEFASKAEFATSDTAHRLRASVGQGGRATVEAVEERVEEETTALVDGDPGILLSWASAIDDETAKAALGDLAAARRRMAAAEQGIADLDGERKRIVREQERIRANLAAVPAQSELATGYLATLTRQEEQLAGLEGRRGGFEARLEVERQAVEAAVGRL